MEIVEILREIGHALEPVTGQLDMVLAARLLMVLVLCGMIGLERSDHERASGFRPHILVGLGACLMTMTGVYAVPEFIETRDPLRVASYVVSGIGFLGAGAILRHGATVRGLTTAASIWSSAGIGVAVGAGMGAVAAVATLLILFTLMTLERLEARWSRRNRVNDLNIHLKNDHRAVGKTLAALNRLGIPVKRATMVIGAGSSALLRVELNSTLTADQVPQLVRRLLTLKDVERVDTASLDIAESPDLHEIELPANRSTGPFAPDFTPNLPPDEEDPAVEEDD